MAQYMPVIGRMSCCRFVWGSVWLRCSQRDYLRPGIVSPPAAPDFLGVGRRIKRDRDFVQVRFDDWAPLISESSISIVCGNAAVNRQDAIRDG
jgi:hypothetical protein